MYAAVSYTHLIVKALAGDLAFKAKYRLGAVNSINWARIAAQVVYYFHGWLRATDKPGQQVSFTVPSGNFGNILSGHIARGMGLPVRHLVLATNENNVLEEFFRTGVYRPRPAGALPQVEGHTRQVLMLAGCVQPSMMPSIDAATIRVLNAIGIGARIAPGAGCCGAASFHLDAQAAALDQMRANVDAWWPLVRDGAVEAIVMNASGCGAMVKEYAHHLRHDPAYAQRAADIVALVKDVAEIVAPQAGELRQRLAGNPMRAAFHPPCTLQHWQGLRPLSERLLADLGFELQPFAEQHLCCGSAGAYSVLNPEIALALRDRKLGAIAPAAPDVILSANIGCIGHLQSGTGTPVRHWIEVVDEQLARA